MNNSESLTRSIANLKRLGSIAAIAGCAVSMFFVITGFDGFVHAYLYAFVFWLTLTLGFFGLTMMINVTRATWGRPLLRLTEAGGGPVSLTVFALLLVPVLLGAKYLYPWAQTEAVAKSLVLQYRSGYMNPTAVGLRSYLLYFVPWILIAFALRTWSLQQDKTGNVMLAQWRTNFSAGALVVFFLTATLAMTDWAMSLGQEFTSTVYGALFIVISGLNGLAWLAVLMSFWAFETPFAPVLPTLRKPLWNDLTNLLLTFTMLWAYLSLSQFLIMWSGNLPDEVGYYAIRGLGGWRVVTILVMLGQFFFPFLCLIAPRTKKPGYLRAIATWIIVMLAINMFWMLVPMYASGGFNVSPLFLAQCAAAWVGLGGIWFLIFTWQLETAALVPSGEYPAEEEILEHA